MSWLSENPWPLITVLGIVALGCLIALRISQQGRFLLWAAAALGLALLAWGIDRLWVTDNERIEAVVYELADAVERSDAESVIRLFAPDFNPDGIIDPTYIRDRLPQVKFDFVRVSKLVAHAGRLSGQGTADFRVHASCTVVGPAGSMNYPTPPEGTDWQLGLREVEPDVWRITRITPVRLPRGFSLGSFSG